MYVDTTIDEYLSFARSIIANNELQRKRVKTSKTIYSLLKSDLKKGCIMPPLVLAMINDTTIDVNAVKGENLLKVINDNTEDILILDGLQRTYTLLDADSEMAKDDKAEYAEFLKNPIRLEVYVEINKFGILYRMLTLNTGQTPMSTRHQMEMLYSGMLNTEIYGVRLVTEKEGAADVDDNEFSFKNVIEGFNSFMNRNELPIDRQEILDNVKVLENMADENVSKDIFQEFVELYAKVFKTLCSITKNHLITETQLAEYEIEANPFGRKASKVFSTSQALTGFGAAIGKMKDKEVISSLDDIEHMLGDLEKKNEGYDWVLSMLKCFDRIRNTSKKIGNAQRMFFQYFFRELFNKDSDSYLDLSASVDNGYKKYTSQVD